MSDAVAAVRMAAGVLAVALALAPGSALGARYKWTDAEGVTHFSDRPPERPPPGDYEGPHPPTVGESLRREREALEREREAARQAARAARLEATPADTAPAAAEGAKPPGERAEPRIESRYTCEQARRFHAYFADAAASGQTFFTQGADGTFEPTSPQTLAGLVEEWREAVGLLCREGQALAGGAPGAEAGGTTGAKAEGSIGAEAEAEGAAPAP